MGTVATCMKLGGRRPGGRREDFKGGFRKLFSVVVTEMLVGAAASVEILL